MIATLAGVEGDVPQEHVAPRPAPAADEPSPPPQPEQRPEQQRRNAQLRRDLQQSARQAALDLSSLDHASAAEELALTTARRARVAELESSVSLGPAEEGAAGSDAGVPSAGPQPMFSEPPWGDARRDVRSNSSWVDGLSRRGRAAGAKLASSRIGAPHSPLALL